MSRVEQGDDSITQYPLRAVVVSRASSPTCRTETEAEVGMADESKNIGPLFATVIARSQLTCRGVSDQG